MEWQQFQYVEHLVRVAKAKAYRKLGWEMEGAHHRGGDAAWNIARILCDLLKKIRMGS